MPPNVPRKRLRQDDSPNPGPSTKRQDRPKAQRPKKTAGRHSLTEKASAPTAEENKKYLTAANDTDDSDEDHESDDEFEDVISKSVEASEDDDEHWEDVNHGNDYDAKLDHVPTGLKDLELTFTQQDVPTIETKTGKKGHSKAERLMRINIHKTHVLCLMWTNTIRNSWICDKELHEILLSNLSVGLKAEIKRWRIASGLETKEVPPKPNEKNKKSNRTNKQKDWGDDAVRQELGVPDMSSGDPLIRLLRFLVSFWKKRFTVTTKSLGKQGYRPVRELDAQIRAYRSQPSNSAIFGERVENLAEFRELARKCEGSADICSQLFTALIRAIGIEARMVVSIQPTGFSWSQSEEATKLDISSLTSKVAMGDSIKDAIEISDGEAPRSATAGKYHEPATVASSKDNLSDDGSDELGSDLELLGDKVPTKTKKREPNNALPYPTYWVEVLSPISNTYYPVSPFTTPSIITKEDQLSVFEPRGTAADKAKLVICYVIAYSSDGSAKDVTVRYLKAHQFPGKTKNFRLPPEIIPLYNSKGRKIKNLEIDWFKKVMMYYTRSKTKRTKADEIEDNGDLVAIKVQKANNDHDIPTTLAGYKSSVEYVLGKDLRREEGIPHDVKPDHFFKVGKGATAREEPVYLRASIKRCKTSESWHKDGREIRIGERPLKMAPIRAVTDNRKNEILEAERSTGEKPMQGLYSEDQTDWIIPPPIKDGVIPKNAFGNIDIYVPSMVPEGAVHLPYRGLKRVCLKLGISFAEACTGFEFGHRMAVPVIRGVVIAEENEEVVIDAWREEEERRKKKEAEKLRAEGLALWRKFANGLRIMEMVKKEYGTKEGSVPDDKNPFILRKHKDKKAISKSATLKPTQHEDLIEDAEDLQDSSFLPDILDVDMHPPSSLEMQHDSNLNITSKKQTHDDGAMKPRSLRSALPLLGVDGDEADHEIASFTTKVAPQGRNRRLATFKLVNEEDGEAEAAHDIVEELGGGQDDQAKKRRRPPRRSTPTTSPFFKKPRG